MFFLLTMQMPHSFAVPATRERIGDCNRSYAMVPVPKHQQPARVSQKCDQHTSFADKTAKP